LEGCSSGAIAAWAWGFHRAVDSLTQISAIDATRIAIVGHSRGGKAALLAGASDERIALTSANNSGAGGAGCWRFCGSGAETLADITDTFPYWFSPSLRIYKNKEHELPFDQHFLKALIAPRYLLTTEAQDDLWANPSGAWRTHQAARQVFEFLGVASNIVMVTRSGEHPHDMRDWQALLNHMDMLFQGQPATDT
jgi:pimeloyl-ACP methyl ester carboxylesterase